MNAMQEKNYLILILGSSSAALVRCGPELWMIAKEMGIQGDAVLSPTFPLHHNIDIIKGRQMMGRLRRPSKRLKLLSFNSWIKFYYIVGHSNLQ